MGCLDDKEINQLEIWYSGKDEFDIEIFYNSQSLKNLSLGDDGWERELDDNIYATFSHKTAPNGDNQFSPGRYIRKRTLDFQIAWKKSLRRRKKGEFHAWIEGGGSIFPEDNPQYTLNSIATGEKSIVVGAYNAQATQKTIWRVFKLVLREKGYKNRKSVLLDAK